MSYLGSVGLPRWKQAATTRRVGNSLVERPDDVAWFNSRITKLTRESGAQTVNAQTGRSCWLDRSSASVPSSAAVNARVVISPRKGCGGFTISPPLRRWWWWSWLTCLLRLAERSSTDPGPRSNEGLLFGWQGWQTLAFKKTSRTTGHISCPSNAL